MATVSDIIYPFSVIYVTSPGVVVLREYSTTTSGVLHHPMFIVASCHAPVSLSAVQGVQLPCRESNYRAGSVIAVQGVFGGIPSTLAFIIITNRTSVGAVSSIN
jgi:hypothetical protein